MIVPGRAEMVFQFRDTDPAILARLADELDSLVAEADKGPCRVTIRPPGLAGANAAIAWRRSLKARATRSAWALSLW